MSERIPRHIELAYEYGSLKEGYTLRDYMVDAVDHNGYETILNWGVQGAGKSCRMLQMGYWIYQDWDEVLNHIIFKPSELVRRLEALEEDVRIPCLMWDDVGVHYTSSRFKTDIQEYEAVDSVWAAIRTKVAVAILTIPNVVRLAKNLKDNLTFEVYLGRNQKEMIKRLFYLPGIDTLTPNFFKITVESPGVFDIYDVPPWAWVKYWKMRTRLANDAIATLKGATNMGDSEGYIPVKDAARYAAIAPNTLQQMISRGVYRGHKVNGVLHIYLDDLNDFLTIKKKPIYVAPST